MIGRGVLPFSDYLCVDFADLIEISYFDNADLLGIKHGETSCYLCHNER